MDSVRIQCKKQMPIFFAFGVKQDDSSLPQTEPPNGCHDDFGNIGRGRVSGPGESYAGMFVLHAVHSYSYSYLPSLWLIHHSS